MDDTEIWKPVVGYEGLYEVSDHGRVRSLDRSAHIACRWGGTATRLIRGRVMRATDNGRGYLMVHLSTNGYRDPRLVHRLVAEAFVPVAEERQFVNHRDGDKTNNTASNLEWCTRAENMAHAHSNGLTDPYAVPVIGVCLRTGLETRYERQIDAEIELSGTGRPSSAVHHCLVGKKKTAYGRAWRLA